jgi:uncharacterized protein GlcG (DUF336 family)
MKSIKYFLIIFFTLGFLFAKPALAIEANVYDITLEQAQIAVQGAIEKAKELKVSMDICIVGIGGNLKYFARMDGAWLGSIDIAIKKARTARFFNRDTGSLGKLSQPGKALYNIEHSNGGLITFPGGIPIKNQAGEVIGAIGVSGSTVENDHAVAYAGIMALQ